MEMTAETGGLETYECPKCGLLIETTQKWKAKMVDAHLKRKHPNPIPGPSCIDCEHNDHENWKCTKNELDDCPYPLEEN